MRTFAVIFARGGSKGIPRKNLALVNGRSLLERAISAGLALPELEGVVVSTEDAEIAAEARRLGADVPFIRPAELATDASPEILSWKHAVNELTRQRGEFDVLLSIPPTAPLRRAEDLRSCLNRLQEGSADVVITICRSRTHPAFNMVRLEQGGRVGLYAPERDRFARRQDVAPAFDITTVAYAVKVSFLREATSYWDGVVTAVEVSRANAVDIDEPIDLEIAAAIERGSEERR